LLPFDNNARNKNLTERRDFLHDRRVSENNTSGTPSRGPNFEKNQRPPSSKRVTFALGAEGQEQADRLARILSPSRKGGVSQSAVVRGLLQLAETAAIESGDVVAQAVFKAAGAAPAAKTGKNNPEAVKIWNAIRDKILEG
jgi:hypothetical protein